MLSSTFRRIKQIADVSTETASRKALRTRREAKAFVKRVEALERDPSEMWLPENFSIGGDLLYGSGIVIGRAQSESLAALGVRTVVSLTPWPLTRGERFINTSPDPIWFTKPEYIDCEDDHFGPLRDVGCRFIVRIKVHLHKTHKITQAYACCRWICANVGANKTIDRIVS